MRVTTFAVAASILEMIVAGPAFSQQQGKPSGGEVAPLESAGEARGGALDGVRDTVTEPGHLQTGDAGNPLRFRARVPGPLGADRNRAANGDESIADEKGGFRRDTGRGDSTSPAENPLNSLRPAIRPLDASLPRSPGISTPSIGGPAMSSGRGLVGAREQGASTQGIDLTTPDGGYGTRHRSAAGRTLMVHTEKRTLPFVVQKNSTRSPLMPRRIVNSSRNAIGVLPPGGVGAEVSGPRRPGISGYVPLVPKDEGTGALSASAFGTTALGKLAHSGNDANHLGDVRPSPPHPVIPANLSAYTAGINGTAIGRTAARSGTIGGPAKDRSAINGTAIRPRF